MKSSTFSDSLFKRRIARTRTGEEFKPSAMNNDFLDREFYQQDIFTRPNASPILPTETPLMIDNAPSENFSMALARYIDQIVQKISVIRDDKKIESLNNLKQILLYVLEKEQEKHPSPERARFASMDLLPITLERRSIDETKINIPKKIEILQHAIDIKKEQQKSIKDPAKSKHLSTEIKELKKQIKNAEKEMKKQERQYSFSLLKNVLQKKCRSAAFKSPDPNLYFNEGEEVRRLATRFMDAFFLTEKGCEYTRNSMTWKETAQAGNISFYLTEITVNGKTHKICYFSGSAALLDNIYGCKKILVDTAETLNAHEKFASDSLYVFVDHYSERFKNLLKLQKDLNQTTICALLNDTFGSTLPAAHRDKIMEIIKADLFLAKTTVRTCAEMFLIPQLAKTLAFYNARYNADIQISAVNLHFYPYGKKGFSHHISMEDVLGELPSTQDGQHYKTRGCCAACLSYKPLVLSMMQSDKAFSPIPSPVRGCLKKAGFFSTIPDDNPLLAAMNNSISEISTPAI